MLNVLCYASCHIDAFCQLQNPTQYVYFRKSLHQSDMILIKDILINDSITYYIIDLGRISLNHLALHYLAASHNAIM